MITTKVCVSAINEAALNRRLAVQIELAVGMAIFAQQKGATSKAKAILSAIYAEAGYQCEPSTAPHYKSVQKRIQAAADLYLKFGQAAIEHTMMHTTGRKSIIALQEAVDSVGITAIDQVRGYVGKVRKPRDAGQVIKTNVLSFNRRAADKDHTLWVHVVTDHLAVDVPPEADPDELIQLAGKLIEVAQQRKTTASDKELNNLATA